MMTGPRRVMPTEFQIHDPNADYGELWAAVHDYLVIQGRQGLGDDGNGQQLAQAYTRMVAAHNMIHRRYVAEPTAIAVAGT